jgi:HYR domain
VRDTSPPALQLPGSLSAVATSAQGAPVTYAATGTDTVDPAPLISCTPPSGSVFGLGATAVNCTATDGSGNQTHGGFTAQVVVSWSDLLAPINPLGVSSFLRGLPIAVKFTLTGGSAGITNLGARLFVAPVDGSGNVGAERPAAGLAPGVANLFRYLPLVGQYLLSLDTTGMAPGVWQLRVDLGDGLAHVARIRLL